MAQDHGNDIPQQRVTKMEACRLLGVSLSTLDRRIAEGQYEVERVQQGQVHRVFVLLPAAVDLDEGPEESGPDAGVQLAVAQERIRSLEDLVSLEREWRVMAEGRVQDLLRALPAPSAPPAPGAPSRPWWKIWA